MSAAFEARPLLPQTTPMQNFSFAPPNMGIGNDKKSKHSLFLPMPRRSLHLHMLTVKSDYVFVDEHNRHKRLKGTRIKLSTLIARLYYE